MAQQFRLPDGRNLDYFVSGPQDGTALVWLYGPRALACAAQLPACVAALCVAGVAPYNAEGLDFLAGQGEGNIEEFGAALQGEEELQKFCVAQRLEILEANAAGLIEALSSLLPDIDKDALVEKAENGQFFVDMFQEGLKTSSDGWVDDDLAFVEPWGFELGEIKVPVLLYQGSEDKMVPCAHGEWLAQNIPHEKLRKHLDGGGQGHISIFLGQIESMVDELLRNNEAAVVGGSSLSLSLSLNRTQPFTVKVNKKGWA
ncbi:hypothetical protein B0O99DRAFT_589729 [Bisporella sp. PMI_857]|nr:hypothetical protein B0O99DRAFT_589729 [Bisporella sp. PMI_857]